jgi:hypothetical protein
MGVPFRPYIHDRGALPVYMVMTLFQYMSYLIVNRLNQSSEKLVDSSLNHPDI